MSTHSRPQNVRTVSATLDDGTPAAAIERGGFVLVGDDWNRTERPHRQVHGWARVLGTEVVWGSQTGMMVTIASREGLRLTLDAGWFSAYRPPSQNGAAPQDGCGAAPGGAT